MFVHLMRRLAQVSQLVLLFEVPQARAVDLHAFEAERLHLLHHFEAFGGVFVVAIGYERVAHTIDPCANGWWGPDSTIGSQPLCERFGSELNWHTRFHLAAHALPALALLAGYAWAIQRWVAPPHDHVTDRPDGDTIATHA